MDFVRHDEDFAPQEKIPKRGILRPAPSYDKDHQICVSEDYDEVKIFFDTKTIGADQAVIKDKLNGLVYNGNCGGYDTTRLLYGDIRVYFNPIYHGALDRRLVIKKVTETLREYFVFVGED